MKCKTCNKDKAESKFREGRRQCIACKSKEDRERVRARKAAKTDATEHAYGKRRLPPGYGIKGVSQFVDSDGEIRAQWIKSDREQTDSLEACLEAIEDTLSKVVKRPPIKVPKKNTNSELLNVLPVGDAHIGLMTWHKEVGESWDLDKAGEVYRRAFDLAIGTAPPADKLLVVWVGDNTHADGGKNTTTSGTPVDVDGRWAKVLGVAIDLKIHAIERGLETHKSVHCIIAGGNHDREASIAIGKAVEMYFKKEPRVTIEIAIPKHHYYQHGKCFLGVTHGDTCKPKDLPMLMAADRPQEWASSEHRHWYMGHVHHDQLKEYVGATVESLRVLVPGDAWHTGQGYRSKRDIKLDTWHSDYGRIVRNTFSIGLIR